MILSSQYQLEKIQRRLDSKESKIRGRFVGYNGTTYITVEHIDRYEIDLIPAACAPKSWVPGGEK